MTNRTAVVTGASSGIGRAIVASLRGRGLAVLAVARNAGALEAIEAECGARPVCLDVRDLEGLKQLFSENEVDIVVNNAGLLPAFGSFQDVTHGAIDEILDVNLKAPLHLSRLALTGMIARRRGHIFFVGSSAGLIPHPNMAVYGASKAGISLFSSALRCDLLGLGVRVTDIVPGRVETGLYYSTLGEDRARRELYEGYLPMQPNDIAEVVLSALSLPQNVNVARVEVFPTSQATGGSTIVQSR